MSRDAFVTNSVLLQRPLTNSRALQDDCTSSSSCPSTYSTIRPYPDPTEFFRNVRLNGCSDNEGAPQRIQPWRRVWSGPQILPDGKILIAVPKKCDFGMRMITRNGHCHCEFRM